MNIFGHNKCEIKVNEKFGRYVVATKDLTPGELILCEQPAVVGPYWGTKLCCLNCYDESAKMCKKCKVAPLCFNCTGHDQFECNFMENSKMPLNFLIDHFDVITPLRCLILSKNSSKAECYDMVLKMESHCSLRRDTNIWKLHENNVFKVLKSLDLYAPDNDVTNEFIQKLCGILDVNTFEVRTPQFEEIPVRGLYPKAGLLAHDCTGNTFITVDSAKTLKVYASVAIPAGQAVYNNYTAALYGTKQRKEHLLQGKYFQCQCARCMDPTEFGTHLSSLTCSNCRVGYIIYDNINNQSMKWKCSKCKCEKTNEHVNELLGEAILTTYNIGMNRHELEEFIMKYSSIFNPNHYLVIEAKQKLAAILRNVCDNSDDPLKILKLLKRKIELCQDMLPILNVLEPGISRLTAIALYEYFSSMLELSTIRFNSKEITTQTYLENLLTIESFAKNSIKYLIYEPPSTPEGDLAKRAMYKLKQIRNDIERMQKKIKKQCIQQSKKSQILKNKK